MSDLDIIKISFPKNVFEKLCFFWLKFCQVCKISYFFQTQHFRILKKKKIKKYFLKTDVWKKEHKKFSARIIPKLIFFLRSKAKVAPALKFQKHPHLLQTDQNSRRYLKKNRNTLHLIIEHTLNCNFLSLFDQLT